MKVVVATWGNPDTWKYVGYVFQKVQERSCTSLRPILRSLSEEGNSFQAYVLASDTMACYRGSKTGIQMPCGCSGYLELKRKLHDAFHNTWLRPWRVDAELVILPGVGQFPNGIFRGDPKDFYYLAFYKLAEILLKDENFLYTEEVILDITHGQNYMPALTYKALEELIAMMNIFRKPEKRVVLKVLNADPFVGSPQENLYIHTIEEHAPAPRVPQVKIKNVGESFEPLLGVTCEELQPEPDEIKAFVSAVVNGFPLVLTTFYPDPDILKRHIDKWVKEYEGSVEVSFGENGKHLLMLERKGKFTEDFKLAAIAWFLALGLKSLSCLPPGRFEVSQDGLLGLAKKVYGETSIIYEIIKRNLQDAKNKAKNMSKRGGTGWIPSRSGPANERHFVAHSGLEYNLVDYKLINDSLWLRYSIQKRKDVITMSVRALRENWMP